MQSYNFSNLAAVQALVGLQKTIVFEDEFTSRDEMVPVWLWTEYLELCTVFDSSDTQISS